MRSRLALTLALSAAMWTTTGAQAQKERCGTRQPGLEEAEQIEVRVSRARKVKTEVTIPVWVHVINKGGGFANGDVPEDMIRRQIRVLDESYSGRTGGAGSGFDFELAGITRTTNATWFSQMAVSFEVELEAKRSLKRDDPQILNIYTVDGGPFLGFAYFPNIVTDPTYSILDGVVWITVALMIVARRLDIIRWQGTTAIGEPATLDHWRSYAVTLVWIATAGFAIALWLVAVVLYDLALLALIVTDGGGAFTTQALPVALLANPADAFRVFNLSAAQAVSAAGGLGGAAGTIPLWQSAASLLLWPLAAIALAAAAFRKVTP